MGTGCAYLVSFYNFPGSNFFTSKPIVREFSLDPNTINKSQFWTVNAPSLEQPWDPIEPMQNLFSEPTLTIKPEVGDFYMFPNYLLHAVYPFYESDDERRSVSFNAKLDDEAVVF